MHYFLCKNCHSYATCTEHNLDRGFISIFCYTDSHYIQRANEPIEQGERCAYNGHTFKALQLSHNRKYGMFFASWNEKGCLEVMSLFLSRKGENSCIRTAKGNIIDVIFTLHGPCQLHLSNSFGKNTLLVALLTHLQETAGDGQTCYIWYQCCQGTRKMETA